MWIWKWNYSEPSGSEWPKHCNGNSWWWLFSPLPPTSSSTGRVVLKIDAGTHVVSICSRNEFLINFQTSKTFQHEEDAKHYSPIKAAGTGCVRHWPGCRSEILRHRRSTWEAAQSQCASHIPRSWQERDLNGQEGERGASSVTGSSNRGRQNAINHAYNRIAVLMRSQPYGQFPFFMIIIIIITESGLTFYFSWNTFWASIASTSRKGQGKIVVVLTLHQFRTTGLEPTQPPPPTPAWWEFLCRMSTSHR